jgi:hypothetical protein
MMMMKGILTFTTTDDSQRLGGDPCKCGGCAKISKKILIYIFIVLLFACVGQLDQIVTFFIFRIGH